MTNAPPSPWDQPLLGPLGLFRGVPSSSVLKPYLGKQKADRYIRSCDCPDHHAGASVVPI